VPGATAVMVAVLVPVTDAAAVARPFEPEAFETLAMFVAEEFQVTAVVRLDVLESEYVPVAVNCCVCPAEIVDDAGVTATDRSCAAVTVNVVEPEMFVGGSTALRVVVPTRPAVAMPREPAAFEMLAMEGLDDCHVTVAVRS